MVTADQPFVAPPQEGPDMTSPIAPASQINAALSELQTQLPYIAKDNTANVPTKTGGSYKYKYADLAQISREVLPLLGKLGLAFTSRPTFHDGRLFLVYELRHISGEEIAGMYPLPNGTPQEIGSAITYARRYCLCAVTGVAPDDDEDAQIAERAARRRERRTVEQERGDGPGVTGEQTRRMQVLFREAGISARDGKLSFAQSVVKRELRSATELTEAEAARVIETLERGAQKRVAGGVAPSGEAA